MNDIVQTKALEILNDQGQMVIRMGSWSDGQPYISLCNAHDGLERVGISVKNDAHGIAIMDAEGKLLLGLGTSDEMGTGVNLFDEQSMLGIILQIDTKSDRNITIFDRNGKTISQLPEND